jgi:hypothetical protein
LLRGVLRNGCMWLPGCKPGWCQGITLTLPCHAQGQGLGGSNATCFTLNSAGGVTFACRDCAASSASPFASASVLRFAVKSQAGGSSAAVPNLRVRAGPRSPKLKAGRGPAILACGACKVLTACIMLKDSAPARRAVTHSALCCWPSLAIARY